MKKFWVCAFLCIIPLAEWVSPAKNDETLRYYLSKSQLVVSGQILSKPPVDAL